MKITQEQLDALNSPLRKKRIKLELLDRDLKVLDTLEGYATDGSINVDANSTIRRNGSITMAIPNNKSSNDFLESIDGLEISVEGKLWIDKYIKIYVGLDKTTNSSTKTVWYKLGVFLIDRPVKDFSATSYQISFNCIDRMAELTGDRQGQLTGIGTTILAGEYVDGQQFLTKGIFPNNSSNRATATKCVYNHSGTQLAVRINDSPYLVLYSISNSTYITINIPTTMPTSSITDIAFSADDSQLALATNGSGIYIYNTNNYSASPTILTYNVSTSTSIDYSRDGNYLAVGSGSYVQLFSISGGSYAYDSSLSPNFNVRKVKFTPDSSFLFVSNSSIGFIDTYRGITSFRMSNKAQVIFPTSFYNTFISRIADFDINATSSLLSLVLEKSPYLVMVDISSTPFTILDTSNINDIENNLSRCKFFNNGNNLAISQRNMSNEENFYVIDTSIQPYKLLPTPIASFTTFYPNTTNYGFQAYDFDISGTNLFLCGLGMSNFYEFGTAFSVSAASLFQRYKTQDTLESIIKDLTSIKNFTIYEIPEDYKYLPYDIKVGTSSTVWDILKSFNDILSTWQFYFDTDGIFRIEPIVSGEKAPVYPVSFNTYISDELSYDFGNVKNQVVVYGKINDCSYYTEGAANVSYSGSKLVLNYDSNIKASETTIKGTKFGFKTNEELNLSDITSVEIHGTNSEESFSLPSTIAFSSLSSNLSFNFIETNESMAVAYSNGSNPGFYYSYDGLSWYPSANISQYNNLNLTLIVFKNNVWLAGTAANGLYYSTDGQTWFKSNLPNVFVLSIDFANNLWIVGTQYGMYYSEDNGETWTLTDAPSTKTFENVVFGNNIWVADAVDTGFYHSTNGKTGWTFASSTPADWSDAIDTYLTPYRACFNIAYGNGTFVAPLSAVGIYYSTDGINWIQGNFSTTIDYYSATFDNNMWQVRGTTRLYYSTDGINWAYGNNSNYISRVSYCGGVWFGTNTNNNNLYYSADGINWETNGLNTNMSRVSFLNGVWLAYQRNTYSVWYMRGIINLTYLQGNLVSFENSLPYVQEKSLLPNEIYTIRIFNAVLDEKGEVDTQFPITFELYSKQQPSACLVDDNLESPFYINNGLKGTNFYAGTAETSSGYNFGEEYKLTLNNTSPLSSLTDGTQITFMANYLNSYASGETSTKITVVTSEGSTLKTALPLVADNNLYNTPVGEGKLSRDYTIHLIQYNATNNVFVYKGIARTAYTLVLSGGEYDNIHTDQLAYERCLWELYQHSNMQDSISLLIVPNYGIDVNYKIKYQNNGEENFFLVKKIGFSLGVETTPQSISAIRIYDSGNLLNG